MNADDAKNNKLMAVSLDDIYPSPSLTGKHSTAL